MCAGSVVTELACSQLAGPPRFKASHLILDVSGAEEANVSGQGLSFLGVWCFGGLADMEECTTPFLTATASRLS